ncbi:hypothetical protein TSUD_346840 [Trifolium subterraneum]|nr:hypothetical protein TSUD_346840 [Trifolium subterraneum]
MLILFMKVHLSERKKISSSSETIGVEQTDFPQSDNTAPKTNLQDVPMTVKTSEDDCKVESNNSKLCLEIGLNVSAQSQISHIGGKRDMENETVVVSAFTDFGYKFLVVQGSASAIGCYLHDVIYIASFVQVASIISGKFWYIYLVVQATEYLERKTRELQKLDLPYKE